MAFKFVVALMFVAAASALELQHAVYQPTATVIKTLQPSYVKQVEYADAPAKYDFAYEVHDEKTGDIKRQQESRDGDVVRGFYSLYDADGSHRVVEYTADAHHGFNAVVRREGGEHQVQAVKQVVAAPVVHKYVSAPVVTKVVAPVLTKYVAAAAPVHYATPVAQAHYAHYEQPATSNYHHSRVSVSTHGADFHY